MMRRRRTVRDDAEEFLQDNPPRRSRFRRSGTWFWTFLFLVVLAAMAPTFLVNSPLVDWAIGQAMAGIPVKVEVGSVALGWLSPLRVDGVKVTDPRGKPLFQAESIRVARALWGLITDSGNLREVVVEKPRIQLELRSDGSNLEDIARAIPPEVKRAWLQGDSSGRNPIPNIRVTEGEVLIGNATTQETWRLGELSVLSLPGEGLIAKRLETSGIIQGPREPLPGKWNITAELGAEKNLLGAVVKTADLPLDVLETVLQRFTASPVLAGRLSSNFNLRFAAESPANLLVDGNSSLQGFAYTSASLKGDAIEIREAQIPLRAELRDGVLFVEKAEFAAPWAQASAQGRFPTALAQSPDPLMQALQQDFRVQGAVDLAAFMNMIPSVFKLREDTQLTEGKIEVYVACEPDAQGRALKAEIRTGKIAGRRGGQTITWDQPLSGGLDALLQGPNWQVRSMELSSEFARLSGSGSKERFTAVAAADLNRLSQELSRFFDTANVSLKGQADAEVQWSTGPVENAPAHFTLDAVANCKGLSLVLPDKRQWQEPSLRASMNVQGGLQGMTPLIIESGQLAAESPSASGSALLLQPIHLDGRQPPQAAFRLNASGDVAQWQARAAALGIRAPYDLGGKCRIDLEGIASPRAGSLSKISAAIENMQVARPEYTWREQRFEITGQAAWDIERGALTVPRLSMEGSAASLVASDFTWEQPGNQLPTVTGNVRYAADLSQLGGLVLDPRYVRASGRSQGVWKFASNGKENTADLSGALEKLLLTRTKPDVRGAQDLEVVWREERANLNTKVRWNQAAGELFVDSANVQSGILQLSAGGKVTDFTNRALAEIRGKLRYDLATITKLLEPRFGGTVRLAGNEEHDFEIVGPLRPATSQTSKSEDPYAWLAELKAAIQFGWNSADVLGIQVGQAKIRGTLQDGAFVMERTEVPVNEGRMFLGAGLKLTPPPSVIALPAGPIVTNVAITPQTCARGLKFVAPILAEVTEAQGSFSLAIEEGSRFPLADPKQGRMDGALEIHGANVRPGPLAREILSLAQQFEAIVRTLDPQALAKAGDVVLVRVDAQTTRFRLESGRVYHDQFVFAFGDVRMKTEGSVGLDETLALEVECQLPSQLAAKYPRLKPLIDRPLRMAVAGDLRKPLMNWNALQSYYAQFARQAAADTLRSELGRQLDRLLVPKK